MGVITVPAGGGGTFLGGYLVKKFNLACAGIIKLCLLATAISICFTACFYINCPNLGFAGVTTGYLDVTAQSSAQKFVSNSLYQNPLYYDANLDASCNLQCQCSRMKYDPICGADGIMYFSPCYAGCQSESYENNIKVYHNCSCIHGGKELGEFASNVEATNTMCSSKCQYMPYFVGICFVLMMFTFMATMPALAATLRYVVYIKL